MDPLKISLTQSYFPAYEEERVSVQKCKEHSDNNNNNHNKNCYKKEKFFS
jgi:hypothetical protein